jgi:hypothetical protein
MSTEDTKPGITTPLNPRQDFGNSQWGLCPAVVRDLNAAGMDLHRYAQHTAPYYSDLVQVAGAHNNDKI